MALIMVAIVFFGFAFLFFLSREDHRYIEPEIIAPPWEFASVYSKRTFLFDSNTEFQLFKILNELFGNTFYIFPQIHYSHLVEVKNPIRYGKYDHQRSRIDKKSADFVLCDKQQVIPRLVIELDGNSHNRADRRTRDIFIDELMKDVNMPIVHIKTSNLNRNFVQSEIGRVLSLK